MNARLLPVAALLGLLAVFSAGHAQDRKPINPEPVPVLPKIQRAVYHVRGGDPAPLAEMVKRHFRDVEVSVSSHELVLSGEAADLQDATKLLGAIDRPAKSVEVEVNIVELSSKGEALGEAPKAADVMAMLPELKKNGAAVRQVRFTAVEGQSVFVQSGRNQPVMSGTAIGGGGLRPGAGRPLGEAGGGLAGGPRGVSYQQVGTTVKAVTSVGEDNAVTIKLEVQEAGVRAGDPTDDVGGGAAAFDAATLMTVVRVPPGQPVLAQSFRSDTKAGRATTLVIVTARVVEGK